MRIGDTKGFSDATGEQMRAALREYVDRLSLKSGPSNREVSFRVMPGSPRLHKYLVTFQPTPAAKGLSRLRSCEP